MSRVTHEQNLEAVHRAGADFVLSYSTLGAEAVLSLIEGHELVILGEGVDLFTLPLPRSLRGKTLAATEIGSRTGLSVVAVEQGGQVVTNLRASMTLEGGGRAPHARQRAAAAGLRGPVRALNRLGATRITAGSRGAGPGEARGPERRGARRGAVAPRAGPRETPSTRPAAASRGAPSGTR